MTADLVPGVLAGACPQVRAAGPDDSVAGVTPRFVASPSDVAEVSAVMQAAAAEGLTVVPRGTGTRIGWGNPPATCDLVIETRNMNRVLEHAAGDLVVQVQAGVELGRLAGVLATAGQRLALDPQPGRRSGPGTGGPAGPEPATGTVGGILASGAAGPLRLRYGTGRDLLIGITLVRADGAVARSGGKVVKNVAGYDLGKLFAGSYGTLGLIAEATFRLHPLPGAVSYVTLDCPDTAAADAVIEAAVDSPLSPSAAEIHRRARGGPLQAGILLEGDPEGVAERSAAMTSVLGRLSGPGDRGGRGNRENGRAAASDTPPPWWGLGAAPTPGGTLIRIAFWAAELASVLAAVDAAGLAAGLDPIVSGSAAAGVLYAALDAAAAPDAVAELVAALRAAVSGDGRLPAASAARAARAARAATASFAVGGPAVADGPPSRGSAVVLQAPAAVRAVADLWGPVPAVGLMRAVKDQFDPEHRMAPGRFAGGM